MVIFLHIFWPGYPSVQQAAEVTMPFGAIAVGPALSSGDVGLDAADDEAMFEVAPPAFIPRPALLLHWC